MEDNTVGLSAKSIFTFINDEFDYIAILSLKNNNIIECCGAEVSNKKIKADISYNTFMMKILDCEFHPDNYNYIKDKIDLANVKKLLNNNQTFNIDYEIENDSLDIQVKRLKYRYYDETKTSICLYCKDISDLAATHAYDKHKLSIALSEAMRANDAKSEFLSRMSHDMRTPLNGIIGLTDIALKENDIIPIKKYLSNIYISGKFLLGLINDVLDMTKIENKKLELKLKPYSLVDFINYVKAIIYPLCAEKNQTFSIDIAKDTPNVVICDELRINQIFFNLLSNATKYTNDGGEINLFIRRYYVGRTNKIGIQFEVSDNGTGMDKEFLERIYEPFNREERGSTVKTQGSGLGLTIVKSLIELMHGTIKIESKVDVGTKVLVHLVFEVPQEDNEKKEFKTITEQENKKTDEYDILNGKKILVVEDNEINLMIETKLLEKIGIKTETATNGQVALEMFMENEPGYYDAILMDIRMPIMDGIESTKEIRRLTRIDAHTIPIIAVTANAFYDDIRACSDVGMNAHVSKPIDPKDLYETLCRIL